MHSLQTRLAWWLVGSVVIMFALQLLITSQVPRELAEAYVTSRLAHDAESLLAGIQVDDSGHPNLDTHYIAPIYKRVFSGHYYVLQGSGRRSRSRSLWDTDLVLPRQEPGEAALVLHRPGPLRQTLLVWTKSYVTKGQEVQIAVAEDMSPLENAIDRCQWQFGLATFFFLVILMVAQRLIVRLSLRPLDQVRDDCRRLELGETCALGDQVPAEVLPLVNELNRLLQVMQQRLERSRNGLGNLTHAIKTPLSVLAQISAANHGLPETDAEQMRRAVEALEGIVAHELRRARLAGSGPLTKRFDVCGGLDSLIEVLHPVYQERRFDVQCNGVVYGGDRQDMLELLGNLLDNACKWAGQRVRVQVSPGRNLDVIIEDDGPGVSEADLGRLKERGVRLDEARPGHGLGLSIAAEIVSQYGGTLEFSRSRDLGGLRVWLHLPAWRAQAD